MLFCVNRGVFGEFGFWGRGRVFFVVGSLGLRRVVDRRVDWRFRVRVVFRVKGGVCHLLFGVSVLFASFSRFSFREFGASLFFFVSFSVSFIRVRFFRVFLVVMCFGI